MVMGLVATPERYKQLDVTVPAMIDPYRLVVPWPKEKSRLLAPVRPFQPIVNLFLFRICLPTFFLSYELFNASQVWLCLALSLVITAPILNVIPTLHSKYIGGRRGIDIIDFATTSRNSIFLLSHLINQSKLNY